MLYAPHDQHFILTSNFRHNPTAAIAYASLPNFHCTHYSWATDWPGFCPSPMAMDALDIQSYPGSNHAPGRGRCCR